MTKSIVRVALFCSMGILIATAPASDGSLPGTKPMTRTGDGAKRNNDTVSLFLDRKIDESESKRPRFWKRDFQNRDAYEASIEPNRQRLRFLIGIRDERHTFDAPSIDRPLGSPEMLAETATHRVYAVSWPVFDLLTAEGLLLEPKNGRPGRTIVHLAHADFTPEDVVGLGASNYNPGFETILENNRIVIPATIDRAVSKYRGVELTHREYVYRPAFQVGRHPIGYEVQCVLALVDWLKRSEPASKIRVEGYGDGGMVAFYAAATDTRIDETIVAGYFDNRNRIFEEPIDRNVFGLLERFGDAEIASLIAPRRLIVVNRTAPELVLRAGKGGAPGTLKKPETASVLAEIERARKLVEPLGEKDWIEFEPPSTTATPGTPLRNCLGDSDKLVSFSEKRPDPAARSRRILDGMDRHTQRILELADETRRAFWSKRDTASPEAFEKSTEFYRDYFAREIIGVFDDPVLAPEPETKLFFESETHTIYEVELDVFDGLRAYGLLLIPKGIGDGEKRPVVVCQHGRNGRPSDLLAGAEKKAYRGFATSLCERGYVVFAPQNMYTLEEEFRANQRKLYPLGKTLYAPIVAQHRQIVDWLAGLSFVDGTKIAFYGLSYGGKTAVRIPPLVDKYCLSICSGDFNYWNVKVASNRLPFSFVTTGEYEMFEFDLANTFDYSDMVALIAPRPFMVERGHVDGVGWDEYVAFEYAKVRFLYEYLLKIPDRTAIHWFDGGHRIDGGETFPFLDRFLKN